jgi:multidrug efflux pump subunit AcrB
MIAWFARNDVAANLLLVAIVIGGLYSLTSLLKLEVFPEFAVDVISVSVPLRGATPEDVELGVAIRIEEAVQDLEGIDKITSRSVEGGTSVAIEVESGYDARNLLNDIKNRVDSINTFPADTEKPIVSLAQHTHEVISVVVAGNYSEKEIRNYTERVRDDLLRVDGITQIKLDAVRKYEISIEASQDRLRDFNLTLADIARAVQHSSLDISAGNVRTDGGDVLIRSKGQAYQRVEFEDIVVKTNADGSIIRVSDIASVNDGFEEVSLRTGFNGDFAGLIQVYRIGDQSALQISKNVRDYIDESQSGLPVGMILSYWNDRSKILKARLSTLINNAIQGGILVIVLLAVFLQPAVALWVFIGIPVSFLGALILMSIFGYSINIMSLFGFIIVLGIVVDDAIVTGENVYSRMREGGDPLNASIKGTKQVAIPVTFGILTTIAAFTPLAFIEGWMGDMIAPIPAVVIPCLLFSLIESKLVLPAHLKHINVNNGVENRSRLTQWQRRFANGFEDFIIKYYRPVLNFSVKNRYSVLAGFVGVLVLTVTLVTSGWTKFTFFPHIEGDFAVANLTMPVGTPFEVTDRHMQRITDAAFDLQKKYVDGEGGEYVIQNILSITGAAGRGRSNADHYGRVVFETIPSDERKTAISSKKLVSEWREIIGTIPGAESLTFRAELIHTGDPIDIQFSGHSLKELSEVGELVKARLATYPDVFDIQDSLADGKEELRIELTRQGHVMGLTRSDIVSQVSQAFRGFEAQRIQRGRDDIRVIVRLPKSERSKIATLDEYLIAAPDGRKIPLSHVATLTPDKGPSTITRIDRYRTMNVLADMDKEKINMTVLTADLREYIDEVLSNYPGIIYSFEGEAKSQRESFGSLQVGLLILLFAIYGLLALPLKSYVEPLIIMSVIPFGVIGAVVGHWLMGRDLTFPSLLGLMALLGVVVNDSLVLVDYINQQKNQGARLIDAVLSAGVARFRPVLLTSLTTFFGLLPLLFEKSVQAQFLIPMGISLGFGILFATVMTLVMIPANVMIVDDIRRFFNSTFGDTPEPVKTS